MASHPTALADDGPSTPAYVRLRERLRQDILTGVWRAGEHQTLAQLSARHRVSLSPIREALLQLQGEGLVTIQQHRGAVVPLLEAELLGNLYDVRAALQSLQARRAAERADAAELAQIALHERGFGAAACKGDRATAVSHNEAFHALRPAELDAMRTAMAGRAYMLARLDDMKEDADGRR